MQDNAQPKANTPTWENKLFVFGFIKDAPQPCFEFAEKLR